MLNKIRDTNVTFTLYSLKLLQKRCLLETFFAFAFYEHKDTPDRRRRRRQASGGWQDGLTDRHVSASKSGLKKKHYSDGGKPLITHFVHRIYETKPKQYLWEEAGHNNNWIHILLVMYSQKIIAVFLCVSECVTRVTFLPEVSWCVLQSEDTDQRYLKRYTVWTNEHTHKHIQSSQTHKLQSHTHSHTLIPADKTTVSRAQEVTDQ